MSLRILTPITLCLAPFRFLRSLMLVATAAAVLALSPLSAGPASAQSFGDALRSMQRDIEDLFGTSDERRRMLRRGDARRRGERVPGDYGWPNEDYAPLSEASAPRPRPTPEQVAANEAARRASGAYIDPEIDAADATALDVQPKGQENPMLATVGRPAPKARKPKADPLDALLGPEPASLPDEGAAIAAKTPVRLVKAPADTPAKKPPPAKPAAKPVAKPSAAAERPKAALQRTAPAQSFAQPAASGGLLSEPAVQITLAFLVGAGLLALAVLREWRGRGPTG